MFGKGKNQKPVVAVKEDIGDDLGRFPSEVDGNPGVAKSTEKALRAVSIVAIVSGMMNVALIMLLITLFPLQKVYPYLVTFNDKNEQVVNIQPMEMGAPGMLYATEDAVRDYIVQRHSFTPIDAVMSAQWGKGSKLWSRTSPQLYAAFASPAQDETRKMKEANIQRTVKINTVTRLADDLWQVKFTTDDAAPTNGGTLTGGSAPAFGSAPVAAPVVGANTSFAPAQPVVAAPAEPSVITTRWVATMRVTYEPQRVTYNERLLNPLGFTVVDYSVAAEKGN
jgi:type IV secretory pathway component VirB8